VPAVKGDSAILKELAETKTERYFTFNACTEVGRIGMTLLHYRIWWFNSSNSQYLVSVGS